MEPTNITLNNIINFNFQIFINLFLYSIAITSGITLISKLINSIAGELIKFIRFKLQTKYKDKFQEIRELNKKMHDRLVDFEEVVRDKDNLNTALKKRLLYNASRLVKYDESIIDDTYLIINSWETCISLRDRGFFKDGDISNEMSSIFDICQKIKTKIDKLLN